MGKLLPRIPHPDNERDLPYKFVALTQQQYAKVDSGLFDAVNAFNWSALWNPCTRSFYAVRHVRKNLQRTLQGMHQFVGELIRLDLSGDRTVDHHNHDTLDNTCGNLRSATRSEQIRNRRKSVDTTSRFKGVSWVGRDQKWQAYVNIEGQRLNLGLFDNPNEAAMARDFAERLNYSEFSQFNFDGGWLS